VQSVSGVHIAEVCNHIRDLGSINVLHFEVVDLWVVAQSSVAAGNHAAEDLKMEAARSSETLYPTTTPHCATSQQMSHRDGKVSG